MYIDFDEYPPYSGAISKCFEENDDANIQCNHGYAYSSSKEIIFPWINEESWEIMQKHFPDAKQVRNAPQKTVCKKCIHVQNEINKIDESFDYPPDNKHTLSALYFMKTYR